MNLLIAGSIVVLLISGVGVLLLRLESHERKRTTRLLRGFTHCAARHGLAFSSQELLSRQVIGLDAGRRILFLVMQNADGSFAEKCIALSDIRACFVSEECGVGGITSRVSLQISFAAGTPRCTIRFYTPMESGRQSASLRKYKARSWARLIMQLVPRPDEKSLGV